LTGPSPVDRSRLGSKHHVICCGNGIPLASTVTAANRNDVTQLLELVDRIAPVGPHQKFRRLARRYDRRADIHQAFLTIGCALICDRHLKRTQPSFC
jgi:hypothetical protein